MFDGFKRCSQWTDALILGSLKTPVAASSCHCGEGRRMEFLFSAKTDGRRTFGRLFDISGVRVLTNV